MISVGPIHLVELLRRPLSCSRPALSKPAAHAFSMSFCRWLTEGISWLVFSEPNRWVEYRGSWRRDESSIWKFLYPQAQPWSSHVAFMWSQPGRHRRRSVRLPIGKRAKSWISPTEERKSSTRKIETSSAYRMFSILVVLSVARSSDLSFSCILRIALGKWTSSGIVCLDSIPHVRWRFAYCRRIDSSKEFFSNIELSYELFSTWNSAKDWASSSSWSIRAMRVSSSSSRSSLDMALSAALCCSCSIFIRSRLAKSCAYKLSDVVAWADGESWAWSTWIWRTCGSSKDWSQSGHEKSFFHAAVLAGEQDSNSWWRERRVMSSNRCWQDEHWTDSISKIVRNIDLRIATELYWIIASLSNTPAVARCLAAVRHSDERKLNRRGKFICTSRSHQDANGEIPRTMEREEKPMTLAQNHVVVLRWKLVAISYNLNQ